MKRVFYYSFILSLFLFLLAPSRNALADTLIATIPVGSQPSAIATLGDKVYSVNQNDSTVSIIDTGNNNTVSSVSVGSSPYGITTLGSKVYVASYGNDTVSVIDTADNNSVSTVSVGSFPYDIKTLGTKVYVANYFGGSVSVIDTLDNNSVTTVPVGPGPSSLGVLGDKVYVTNSDNGTLSIIDTSTNSVSTITVGPSPSAITTMGSKVYVLNYGDNTISVVDTQNGNSVSSVTVGLNPFALTTLDNKVYVANYSSNTVSVIDTLNNNAVTTISVETGPYAITALTSLGSRVYVASQAANKVSIIDTLNNNTVTTINVGSSPSSITTLGDKVYVGNYGSDTISIIQVELPPVVLNISSTKPDGTYTIGEIIDINVTFSEDVTSTGDVTVTLETGATDQFCTFTVTNSNTGTCNYTVQAGDMSLDLDVASISGVIADQTSNPMTNFTPVTSLATNKAIIIDTTIPPVLDLAPTITNITSPKADGTYGVGELIDVAITFSEAVTSTGDVTVTLETGVTDQICTFSITNTTAGMCIYTVQAGDASADLTVFSVSGTITDQTNNAMVNFTPLVNLADNKAIVIDAILPPADTTAPVVLTISPKDGSTGVAPTTDLIITFDENVTIGTGSITLRKSADDSTVEIIDVTSAQVTGGGTNIITVNPTTTLSSLTSYYVQIAPTAFSDTSANVYGGITDTTTWDFTIADVGVPAVLSLSPLTGSTGITVNTDLVITFDEAVAVGTGNIVLLKTSDSSVFETIDVTSAQVTGGGTTTITINPTGTLADLTDYAIQIAPTAFTDMSANPYAGITDATTWVFTSGDFTPATIDSITSSTLDGTYTTTNTIDVTVVFSEAVTSTGDITVTLETGATDRTCVFTVTDSNTGGCTYTVELGDMSLDLNVVSITGSISDQNSNTMTNFTPITNLADNKAIVVDTTIPPVLDLIPTITNINSDKIDGTYTTGEIIDIDVTFSEPVTSTGDVTVTLETGATDQFCTFTITNSTTETCDYTVQAGDASLDLAVKTIAGTIKDQTLNAIVNFTPLVNLDANKVLVVDTTAPVISEVTAVVTPSANTTPSYVFTTNESGAIVYGGDCTSDTLSASVGLNTVTFAPLSASSHTNCTIILTDFAGNQSNTIAVSSFTIDTIAPKITNITSDKANGTYGVSTVIDIDVTFSEPVTSTGNVTVTLETGSTDRTCTFTVTNSTTGTCNYTVQTGDTSLDLDVATVSGLIKDQVNNSMDDFIPVANLASNKAIVIGVVIPVNTPPSITLNGANPFNFWSPSNSPFKGNGFGANKYHEPGFTAFDTEDGIITSSVIASTPVLISSVGTPNNCPVKTYAITYTALDSQGLSTQVVRTVIHHKCRAQHDSDWDWGDDDNDDGDDGEDPSYNLAPKITNITSDKANGTYGVSTVIDIDVTFSEPVTSTGNVTVTLETGSTDRTCTFTVTNSTTGTCNYTVQTGDTSADLNVKSITGVIKDQSNKSMTNFVPMDNLAENKALVVGTAAPRVTNITSNKSNGTYGKNVVIDIDVTFSEPVTSTGPVTVTLETGPTDRTCTFTVTNSNFGTCNYTTQLGDRSPDLTVKSITGVIKDQSNNPMTNFTPITNLASNKALVIGTSNGNGGCN